METTELLKKIRKVEIKSRGLSNNIFAGEFHSAFKGRGMSFSEVREYQHGDDIRTIDWNVTARFNHPYVKTFEEERELVVMLIVDISASEDFGTAKQFKKDLLTELCAVLAFSAMQNNDKIGMILFSDKVEKFIPPKKGRTHILKIIRELIEFKPSSKGTNIARGLQYFTTMIRKKSIAFVISDFMNQGFEDAIKIACKKHDLVAIRLFDQRETQLPNMGLIKLQDAEKQTRNRYNQWWQEKDKYLNNFFAQNKIDAVQLRTDQPYVQPLMQLFKKREKRH